MSSSYTDSEPAALDASDIVEYLAPGNMIKPHLNTCTHTHTCMDIHTESLIDIVLFQNYMNVSNQNYFPIEVKSIEMTVQYDTMVLVPSVKNTTLLEVPLRSEKLYYVQANITLDKDNQMGYMA